MAVAAAALAAVAAPTPASAARSWQDPVRMTAPGHEGQQTATARTTDGTTLVTWREYPGHGLFVADADAGPAGATQVGTGWSSPSVAPLPGGAALLVWIDLDGVLRSATRLATGEITDRAVLGRSAYGGALATNTEGAAVLVAPTSTYDERLVLRRRTPGGAWSEPVPFTDVASGDRFHQWWRVVLGPDGSVVMTWLYGTWDDAEAYAAIVPPGEMQPDEIRTLSAPGRSGQGPSVAMDAAGNAIITFVEAEPGHFAGPLRYVLRPAGGDLGDVHALDGSADTWEGAPIKVSPSGALLVVWDELVATSAGSGYGRGMRASVGRLPLGPGPVEDVSHDLSNQAVGAIDDAGNAILFFEDWDTWEMRAVRRSASGLYGQARNVMCPRETAWMRDAAVDAGGNATLVWAQSGWFRGDNGVHVVQDEPSATFSPDPCPPPPPLLTWTPREPDPGETVTFDASGAEKEQATTTWSWDLDGDGTFEVGPSGDPVVEHAFSEAGEHQIGLRIEQWGESGNGATTTCSYTVRVGMPPQPEEPADPDGWGWDPAPPDRPFEDPWPVPGTETAPPPGDGLGIPVIDPHTGAAPTPFGTAWRRSSALSPIPREALASPRGGAPPIALGTASRQRLRRALRSGIPVAVSAPGRVRLTLNRGSRRVARPVVVKPPREGARMVTLQLTRSARRSLARRRSVRLSLAARLVGRELSARQPLTLRR